MRCNAVIVQRTPYPGQHEFLMNGAGVVQHEAVRFDHAVKIKLVVGCVEVAEHVVVSESGGWMGEGPANHTHTFRLTLN